LTFDLYLLLGLLIALGLVLGKLLRRLGLTEVLGYLAAGVILGPLLKVPVPNEFGSIITAMTLAFVAYRIGSSFSLDFLRKMGKKVVIILVVEVVITFVVVWLFIYLLTRNMGLSIIVGALAPATAPAGTIAVFRDLRARGLLTDVSVAIVGLDDAAGIILYSLAIVWARTLFGANIGLEASIVGPTWEILGAIVLGALVGFIVARISRFLSLSSDTIFVVTVGVSFLSWGIARMVNVSAIFTCMILGMTIINLNTKIGDKSNEVIDSIMTPLYILFFGAIGLEISVGGSSAIWGMVVVYTISRVVGKLLGCGLGGVLSRSEPRVTKYLGIALLNQAGVQMGLAFLAAQELAEYLPPTTIITLMAVTTAVFQIFSPLGTQYAVKKTGEGTI